MSREGVHEPTGQRVTRRGRVLAVLLAAVLAAVGLAACGGGSSTSTPAASAGSTPAATTPATTPTTPATTTPTRTSTATTPTASAKPAESAPRSPSSSSSSSPSGGSGGGAASFRAPSGDNSIPDYGSEAPPSERERATAALAAFLRARAGGDWATACTYLAAATRTQLERFLGAAKAKQAGGCARVLGELSKGSAAHAETLTLAGGVVALRIKGTSAFALFHGPKSSKYVMPMRSEGGAWKMSQLAPLPYPLGSTGATP